MKGDRTLKILGAIGNATIEFADLLSAVLESGYGASASQIEYRASVLRRARDQNRTEANAKQKYYMLLYQLKRDGLIQAEQRRSKKFLHLTSKGKERLSMLKERHRTYLPLKIYPKEGNKGLTIVAFDVPEKERKKRDWLRFSLRRLNFSMIQKSVWLGKAKVPKDFLRDLQRYRLIDCVEIFEITRSGSLRHIM